MDRKAVATALVLLILKAPDANAGCTSVNSPKEVPAALKYVQYFQSRVQDVPGCAMQVVDGRIIVQANVTNPAASCPDMFAWKLFAEAVTDRFWRNWAADQETWPGNGAPATQPYPLWILVANSVAA